MMADRLPNHQTYIAVAVALTILVAVLELVRRRKLREEYSFLWVCTATILMALAFAPSLLDLFKRAIGAETPTSALFFGGLMFCMFVALLFSVRLSRLTFRTKMLTRQAALAQSEIEEMLDDIKKLRAELRELSANKSLEGPNIGRPDIGRPNIGKPDIGKPDIGRSDIGRPDIGRSDAV